MEIRSPAGAAAASAGVGKRSMNAVHFGMTLATWVCCDITSLTKTSHGSLVWRHGNSRTSVGHHASKADVSCGTRSVTPTV